MVNMGGTSGADSACSGCARAASTDRRRLPRKIMEPPFLPPLEIMEGIPPPPPPRTIISLPFLAVTGPERLATRATRTKATKSLFILRLEMVGFAGTAKVVVSLNRNASSGKLVCELTVDLSPGLYTLPRGE